MIHKLLLLFGCVCCAGSMQAQYTTDKVMGDKNQSLADSLKNATYPYLFPIWGEKVVRKGFNIPKSAGLSTQYVYQQSDIIINNLMVGFNNGEMHSLDQVIRFNNATATSNAVNIRPDLWVLPFLNVYLILAQSKSSTAIDASVWLPDDSTWKKITDFSTQADFNGTTFGFGITPTVGIRGFFIAIDMNFSWTDIDALDEPAYIFILGPRLGKNITFKNRDRSLALWVGGFRVKMATTTNGSLNASELFPIDQWQTRLGNGYTKVDEHQQKVDNWWNGLTTTEQKNPVNAAKHETANRVLARFGSFLDQASQVVAGAGESSIQYSLNKKPKDMWNFIVGGQFQLNRSWMLRAEFGFLGSREQAIVGLQYRFNL
jgi:hypothetical protein